MVRALLAIAALGLAGCAPTAQTAQTGSADPAASEATGLLFVANKRGDTLSQIDLATGEELRRVPACRNPHELAVSPDRQHVALACYGGTRIALFRADNLARLLSSIDLGENAQPHGIVWHANGDIYATAEGRRSVFWVRDPLGDAETFEYATQSEGSHMLAVSPDARHAWTTNLGSKTVTRIDLLTRRAPLSREVGVEPEGIALSPDGKTLWVSARRSNKAFALDPQTLEIEREIAVGAFPLRIALRPQGDFAVTLNLGDTSLSVIDSATGEVVRTIALDDRANAEARQQVTILWSPDGERIYVAETYSDTIAEVDFASGTVLRRFAAGQGGDGLATIE